MTQTAADVRAGAAQEVDRLGPEPATARECVQWRERRDSAAMKLAARANWNTALLAQAASLAAADGDEGTHQLLRDASDWTPRVSTSARGLGDQGDSTAPR